MENKAKAGCSLVLCVLAFATVLTGNSWAAISISVSGAWSETVDEFDLAGPPGSDLVSTYESTSNQVSIDITGTAGDSDAWRVDIKRADTAWHGNLHLYVRRTSSGSGTGTITGGDSYLEVTDTFAEFFSGSGDRTGINVQLKITGVSVGVPSDAYSTTVYYTVVDIE